MLFFANKSNTSDGVLSFVSTSLQHLQNLEKKGVILSNNELTIDTLLRSKITNIYIKSVGGQVNEPEVYINIDAVEVLNMNKFEN